MWWLKRRRIEGLIAASAYETLDPGEQAELDAALAEDADLRATADGILCLTKRIPADRPELDIDLLPRVRARLADRPAWGVANGRHLAFAGAACMFLIGAVAYTVWTNSQGAEAPVPGVTLAASPVEPMLEDVRAAVSRSDYAAAFELLNRAVADHPRDRLAGEAQYTLAQLADERCMYPEAHAAYTRLRADYRDVLANDPERERTVADRYDVLDEARKVQFASLQALDAARQTRGSDLSGLEEVIIAYPSTRVAELAALDMAYRVAENPVDGTDPAGLLAALKTARGRCTAAVAVARLDLEIGHVYSRGMRDATRAEEHYMKAAEVPVLAQLAHDAMDRLAAAPSH
ncbi:MAG: hypothetical protein GY851_32895 [bacterium]|nr:hypothetical protein [bacterium]